jgi:hypothetical protein
MKRNTTILFVFALLLTADGLCIRQTLYSWPEISGSDPVRFLTAEIAAATVLILFSLRVALPTIVALMTRSNRQSDFSILQPLRRLFVSVWF